MYEWRTKALAFEVEVDSLRMNKQELEVNYQQTKEVATKLEEQMEALRMIWKEKVQENERLKQKQQALEAINTELSIKLNELRTQKLTGV